jgi:ribosomal protein L40E
MTVGLGVFLLIFAVSMPFLIGAYTLSILLAVVFFLMGMFGVVAGSRIKARPIPTSQVAQNVLIEVKCKSCNALNPETSEFCARCGARL